MQDIMLTIKGSHKEPGGEEDVMELLTTGNITKDDEAYIIEYDESAMSGMENTWTRLKIMQDSIHMERTGLIKTEFVFADKQNFEGVYETPFGTLSVSVFPMHVMADVCETHGSVDLQYEIKIGGTSSLNRLNIEYKSKEEEGGSIVC